MKKIMHKCSLALMVAGALAIPSVNAEDKDVKKIIFKNVNIFNGVDDKLYKDH